MRCFVTGATGFVGSAVTRLLVDSRFSTAILVRENSSTKGILQHLIKLERFVGDIHDSAGLETSIRAFQPDTILHLGWSGVSANDRNHSIQLENHLATLRLIDLAIQNQVKTFVGIGSQAEYGPKPNAISETSYCDPQTLYGAAKLASSILGDRLCQQSKMRFVWMRLFSCYGPGDHPSFMIPSVISALLSSRRPSLTQATQKWDYLFVEDAAQAVVHAASNPRVHGIYNLGAGKAVELRQVIETIRDSIDSKLDLGFGEIPYGPNALMHLEADTAKLQATGWYPKTSLHYGIPKTIEWFRKEMAR